MNRLTKTLGALALTLGSIGLLGCPDKIKSEPSPYTFITKPKEIKQKFVDGENVDVRKALKYNPIPNPLVKALTSYLSDKSLQTVRTIYVQYGVDDSFPTFSGLEQAVASANTYSDPSEILVGEGTFETPYIIPEKPIRIQGEGADKTTLRTIVYAQDYIELSNTRMEGNVINVGQIISASLGLFGGGNVNNNLFYGTNGAVAISPFNDTVFENNTFDKVADPEYGISISFEDNKATDNKQAGTLTMRYNWIRNTPIAIQLFKSADCGIQGDLGNNFFLDVGTVVYNPYNYPQGFVGNAWAETKP